MIKKPPRQQKGLDPAVRAALGIEGAGTYLERKAQHDRERVRLRLDVPSWLKDAIEREAGELQVSMSNLSAFFLAYGLKLYRDGDPVLLDLLEASKTEITSLRWKYGLVLDDLAEALTDSAETDVDLDLLDL